MLPGAPRRTRPLPPLGMPCVEGLGRAAPRVEPCPWIEQLLPRHLLPEVLVPQGQSKPSGERPRPVAEPSWIGRETLVALVVEHGACQLGVMGPGASVQIVGPDPQPHVIDHAELPVNVDRPARLVL